MGMQKIYLWDSPIHCSSVNPTKMTSAAENPGNVKKVNFCNSERWEQHVTFYRELSSDTEPPFHFYNMYLAFSFFYFIYLIAMYTLFI